MNMEIYDDIDKINFNDLKIGDQLILLNHNNAKLDDERNLEYDDVNIWFIKNIFNDCFYEIECSYNVFGFSIENNGINQESRSQRLKINKLVINDIVYDITKLCDYELIPENINKINNLEKGKCFFKQTGKYNLAYSAINLNENLYLVSMLEEGIREHYNLSIHYQFYLIDTENYICYQFGFNYATLKENMKKFIKYLETLDIDKNILFQYKMGVYELKDFIENEELNKEFWEFHKNFNNDNYYKKFFEPIYTNKDYVILQNSFARSPYNIFCKKINNEINEINAKRIGKAIYDYERRKVGIINPYTGQLICDTCKILYKDYTSLCIKEYILTSHFYVKIDNIYCLATDDEIKEIKNNMKLINILAGD